jgi:CRP-like cAMP-binding protein/small-conductance mechanosensitive channel
LLATVLYTLLRAIHFLPKAWIGDPELVANIALAFLQVAVIQVVHTVLFNLLLRNVKVPRWAAESVVVAAYLAVLADLLYHAGVNVTGIFATSAVATAVVGLALQEMLVNMASGIAIQLEGSIQPDQYLHCGALAGWVEHVRLRHTELRTSDGETLVVPNSYLMRNHFAVHASAHRRKVLLVMPYGFDPQTVMNAVEAALRSAPITGMAATPAPECILEEMLPGHIKYAARVWLTDPALEAAAVSAVNIRCYYALKRLGMPVGEIPTSLQLVGPKTAPATVDHTALLRRAQFFRNVDDAEIRQLEAHLTQLSYGPGEYIIRQGDQGESMFFLVEGTVALAYRRKDGLESEVKEMAAGDYFGEFSLMTGEPRSASVLAKTRVECCMLDKAGIRDLMLRRPELAEDISAVMAHRQLELSAIRDSLEADRVRSDQVQLVSRIRRFFQD